MHSYLTAQGLKVAKIHGDIAPRERKRIMNQVKNLDFEYIVATVWQRVELTLRCQSMLSMMPFRKTYLSLCTVLVVLDETAYQVQLLPSISQVMTRISVSWRNGNQVYS